MGTLISEIWVIFLKAQKFTLDLTLHCLHRSASLLSLWTLKMGTPTIRVNWTIKYHWINDIQWKSQTSIKVLFFNLNLYFITIYIIYHTTKITVTSVISHFDIVWYYKNPISSKYHIFWLCGNTKYQHF